MTQHDPITSILWLLLRWALWLIIVFGVVVSIWSGVVELPTEPIEPRYRWLDVTSIVCGVGAVAMLLVGQIAYADLGNRWTNVAAWVEICCWTPIELRFIWTYIQIGDVPVHPLPLLAIVGLCIGSMLRSLSRWAHIAQARDSVTESSGTRGLPTNWPSDNFEDTWRQRP